MLPRAQGYYGVAVGKGRQAAKTELEKLKLGEITCREAVKAIAKMYAPCCTYSFSVGCRMVPTKAMTPDTCSIHTIHDDVKDKEFVLEMSWACEESGGGQELVPSEVIKEAEAQAKVRRRWMGTCRLRTLMCCVLAEGARGRRQ